MKLRRRKKDRLLGAREETARRERRSRLVWAAALMLAFIVISVALDSIRCAREFVITEYELPTSKVTERVSIVMVSDLHESEFGENNERLIKAIRGLEPDLILCAGDIITRTVSEDRLHIGVDFMAEMVKIAPTYMSLGNHEAIFIQNRGYGPIDAMSKSGVVFLEARFEDAVVRGQTIRIGGISDYCFNYGQTEEEYKASRKYLFFKDMVDTEDYKILLCHRPTAYRLQSEIEQYEDWDVDLVLSGHVHGGLWQFPFIGSVYLPQQGFFPELDKGLVDMGKADMIIGAGLGSEPLLFRFNNPCEIVSITLVPEG